MIARHKGEVPFAVLLIPFILGIAFGLNFAPAANAIFLFVLLCILITVFLFLNLVYRRFNIYKRRWLGGILIHCILFTGGWLALTGYVDLNKNDHFSKIPAKYLLVKISNEPNLKNGMLRFTAEAEENISDKQKIPSGGNLIVTIKDSAAKYLYYGDELLIPANYQPVAPPANPAEFNYKKYLANQNIHFQSFLRHGQYFLLQRNTGNTLIAFSLRLRQRLVERFKQHMHSPEAIAVASTLMLGYKADLSNDILQAYSTTGTIHVLSVSGAHVAIVFILLEFVFGFLNRSKHGRTIKAILIISIIWYYALLSGFSPAVCRAAVMISMVIIGRTYNRTISTLNILAVSAFALLLYDPLFITDVGFQLSYLAVAGLIILQPVVYKWFRFKNKWADRLWALCSVSLAAQVITFPLSAYYFHQFPVYFLISNLFIVIPSTVIMYAGIAYFLLGWIPILGGIFGYILEKSILIMDKGLAFIENAPWSGISKIWLTTVEYLLLYGIIISVFYWLYNRKPRLLQLSLCFTILFAISISMKRWNNLASNTTLVLNVRRHACTVIRKGSQATVITDLADTDKSFRYSVQPFLDSCQVSNVRLVKPVAGQNALTLNN
ncbi:MAG TPA: ComEC/Rec2 family competence protein [Mucilaginibacter sp.]|jgi:competence protein ComEC|nr:ComEC/Rec2 family competence protein [Mucilaginibacter sp.]